jgi:hypothetical protein
MPPALYHGSPAKIEKFLPRDGKDAARNPYFGTMATDSKEMAMLYALKMKEGYDAVTGSGALGGVKDELGNDAKDFMLSNNLFGGTFVSIFRNRDRYLEALEKSGGGYVYSLPAEGFEALPRPPRTPTTEWLSPSTDIAPAAVERVTLDDSMRAGNQVLFLRDGVDVNELIKAYPGQWDEGEKQLALYKQLIEEGVLINENAARGISNPLNLPSGANAAAAAESSPPAVGSSPPVTSFVALSQDPRRNDRGPVPAPGDGFYSKRPKN